MTTCFLNFTLISDATFGRGEGVPGLVDEEVEHNGYGLPYLRGRTLKGLLVEECANILFGLYRQWQSSVDKYGPWQDAADRLFGVSGTTTGETAILRISDACLPDDLQKNVAFWAKQNNITRLDVLESLTAIRRQTAMDTQTGRPDDGSLRSMRVIIRQTPFIARLRFLQPPSSVDLALLSACIKAFRRGGVGRNRGRGCLSACLLDDKNNDVTATHFKYFKKEALGL
jgi:CRISPR/Cas system CSM-associated protein Csm3 (group 7 of RAMP superfamily)